jgi:hypothetical protein
MRDMVRMYRDTIAEAARYIACGLADRLILPVTDPRGYELASALARMGGVAGEVDALLAVPVATLPLRQRAGYPHQVLADELMQQPACW